MPKVKITISRMLEIKEALVKLGREKLPYTFQINKNLKSINKHIQEYLDDEKKLRESFYETIVPEKKEDGINEHPSVFKKFLSVREGKRFLIVKDENGAPLEYRDGDKLKPGEAPVYLIPDDRIEEFSREKKKLDDYNYEIDIHQILEDELENDIRKKFEKTGESIDSNITEPLYGVIIVEAFTD